MAAIVALLTDFGLRDQYVGAMKGVLLSVNPHLCIVDISHEVPHHAVETGAFLLKVSYAYFPHGTVFAAVVDPGVGSSRKAVALKTKHYFFVGPDNGVLYEAADKDGIEKKVALDAKKWHLPGCSRTFHGRDIFAPAAAYLSKGVRLSLMGTPLRKITPLKFPSLRKKGHTLQGKIIYYDTFGNLITSIPAKEAVSFLRGKQFIAHLNGKAISQYRLSYEAADSSAPFFIEGSSSFLEVSLRRKSAREYFKARTGDTITLMRRKK